MTCGLNEVIVTSRQVVRMNIMEDFTKTIVNFPKFQTLHGMSDDTKLMYKYCVAVETGLYDGFVYMSGGLNYNSHVAECLERMVYFIINVYYKVSNLIPIHSKETGKRTQTSTK